MPNQTFGSRCAPDIRAASRDSVRGGAAAKKSFQLLRRKGGQPFKDAIIEYRTKCSGLGRGKSRNSFSWCQYQCQISAEAKLATGKRLQYMSKGKWCNNYAIDNMLSLANDKLQIQTAFAKYCDEAAAGMVSADRNFVWAKCDDFIQGENVKSQSQHVIFGQKVIVNVER